MTRILLAVCLTLVGLSATAQIYKHVDENGNVTFTDKPSDDAQPVELQTPNSSPPPPQSNYPTPTPPPSTGAVSAYQVTINSPANDSIIPNGPGNFSVSASVSPQLAPGNKLQLLVDGTANGEPQMSGNWALTNVFRGEHTLVVNVVDSKGKQVAASGPVKIAVFRPSSHGRAKATPR